MSTPSTPPGTLPFRQPIAALPPAARDRRDRYLPAAMSDRDRALHALRIFQAHGGLRTGEEVARALRRSTPQPLSLLARWIIDSRVISLAWCGEYLLPMFQFELGQATVRQPVLDVLEALGGCLTDLDLVGWFALPLAELDGAAPIDAVDMDLPSVIEAARTTRRNARS